MCDAVSDWETYRVGLGAQFAEVARSVKNGTCNQSLGVFGPASGDVSDPESLGVELDDVVALKQPFRCGM